MKVSLKSENGPRPSQQIHDLGRQSSDLGRGQPISQLGGRQIATNWPAEARIPVGPRLKWAARGPKLLTSGVQDPDLGLEIRVASKLSSAGDRAFSRGSSGGPKVVEI